MASNGLASARRESAAVSRAQVTVVIYAMTRPAFYAAAIVASLTFACRPAADREPLTPPRATAHEITATIGDSQILARDSVAAGWTTLRLRGAGGEGHNLVAFRLHDTLSIDSFLAALDTAKGSPVGSLALGGPEEVEPDVTMHLAPGRVLLTCLMRDAQGRRHAVHGEAKLVHAIAPSIPSDTGVAPVPTATVSMTDFAYPGSDTWPAGTHTITISNDGAADHLMLLTRLRAGETLRQFVTASGDERVGEYLGGIARMGPGRSASISLELKPGNYVLTCLVTDPRTGQQHAELGMLKLVHVVDRPQ